jgi:hypothetical protein
MIAGSLNAPSEIIALPTSSGFLSNQTSEFRRVMPRFDNFSVTQAFTPGNEERFSFESPMNWALVDHPKIPCNPAKRS